jgi:DNA-binding CsgD family transcriptional regulator
MPNLQILVGLDHNARIMHLFHADAARLPVAHDELLGKPLGSFAATDAEARTVRATFAECLFTGQAQECTITIKSGSRYHVRFEKVIHKSEQTLRPEDEVAVLGLALEVPATTDLTGRERQVVQLICQDMSNLEMARQLKISASTVETHRQNLRQKLGVKGTAGVVRYALRQGWADLD